MKSGLYLPVDDVISVAVVDTLKDLLHENGSVFLGEFASSDDFIEKLTSLAYSIGNRSLKLV